MGGCLPPTVVFHQRLSSTKGCHPPKVVFHRRLSSTEGRLPPKVVFHQRSSFTKGVFHQPKHLGRSYILEKNQHKKPHSPTLLRRGLPLKVVLHRKFVFHVP